MTAKKAILVVSFGTSFNDNRAKTIGAVEKDIAAAFPDYEVRRAFTSKMIIAKLKKRDNEHIDYITEAIDRLADDGFTDIVVQPTHIMNGIEYDFVAAAVKERAGKFQSVKIGKPLLTSEEDYNKILDAVGKEFVPEAEKAAGGKAAIVFMGHGTEHFANATYGELQIKFMVSNLPNVFVTTVEGFPGYYDTLKLMDGKGIRRVVLMPFMLVAGDHANNDMAGDDDDSMKNVFSKEGYTVTCIVKGLGEYASFRKLFVEHVADAIKSE